MANFIEDYPIEEEVERYYKYLNEEESQLFLSRLINFNKDKLTDPFYSRFFAAIKRGSDNGDIFLIICTSNKFRSILKNMIGIPLIPFSGFKAIRDILVSLLEESIALSFGGIYDSDINKMFIILKNPAAKDFSKLKLDIMYKLSDFTQGYLLLHEMCHYFSANNHNDYINLFRAKYLEPYYDTIFSEFARVFLKKRLAQDVVVQLRNIFLDVFENTYVDRTIYRFTEEEFNKMLDVCNSKMNDIHDDFGDLWRFLVIILNTDQTDYKILHYAERARSILRNAYKQNGWNISNKVYHFQELIHPSEIIAVASIDQYRSSEYLQMLTKIFS